MDKYMNKFFDVLSVVLLRIGTWETTYSLLYLMSEGLSESCCVFVVKL